MVILDREEALRSVGDLDGIAVSYADGHLVFVAIPQDENWAFVSAFNQGDEIGAALAGLRGEEMTGTTGIVFRLPERGAVIEEMMTRTYGRYETLAGSPAQGDALRF